MSEKKKYSNWLKKFFLKHSRWDLYVNLKWSPVFINVKTQNKFLNKRIEKQLGDTLLNFTVSLGFIMTNGFWQEKAREGFLPEPYPNTATNIKHAMLEVVAAAKLRFW